MTAVLASLLRRSVVDIAPKRPGQEEQPGRDRGQGGDTRYRGVKVAFAGPWNAVIASLRAAPVTISAPRGCWRGATRPHPCRRSARRAQTRGMSAAELARRLQIPTNRITGILNGSRGITGDTALRLALLRHVGRVLDEPAEALRPAPRRSGGGRRDGPAAGVGAGSEGGDRGQLARDRM